MSISALIRKGGLASLVTATPATLATHGPERAETVAKVATVAVAAPQEPVPTMTAEEQTTIRTWLARIKETDPDLIAEVLNRCRTNLAARIYALGQAEEMPRTSPDYDDRRHCAQCANLAPSGLCLAALRGEIVASRTYHPVDDIPRRCEGYAPGPNDLDRRSGRERWPALSPKTPETAVQIFQIISAKSGGENGRNR